MSRHQLKIRVENRADRVLGDLRAKLDDLARSARKKRTPAEGGVVEVRSIIRPPRTLRRDLARQWPRVVLWGARGNDVRFGSERDVQLERLKALAHQVRKMEEAFVIFGRTAARTAREFSQSMSRLHGLLGMPTEEAATLARDASRRLGRPASEVFGDRRRNPGP